MTYHSLLRAASVLEEVGEDIGHIGREVHAPGVVGENDLFEGEEEEVLLGLLALFSCCWGRWVGGKMEESEAVGMWCCELGLSGWGGWRWMNVPPPPPPPPPSPRRSRMRGR